MTDPTENSEPPKNKLDLVIALGGMGDIEGLRLVLGIPAETVDDNALIDGVVALQEGLQLARQDRHTEAVEPLAQASQLLTHSSDVELRNAVLFVESISHGLALLLAGDAHGAHERLNFSYDMMRRLAFFDPSLRNLALKAQALSHIALARMQLNLGDVEKAALWLAKADDVHDQLLSLIDQADPDAPLLISSVVGTRLEATTVFAFLDLQALDLRAMGYRLAGAKKHDAELGAVLDLLEEGATRDLLRLERMIYAALLTLRTLSEKALVQRRHWSQRDIGELSALDADLFECKQLAIKCRERGMGFMYLIDFLRRFVGNLLTVGGVTKADFGRFAGLVSAAVFVVLLIVTHVVMRPSGVNAWTYFLGDLVVAVIAGFGYGALRFKPLFDLLARTQEKRAVGSETESKEVEPKQLAAVPKE